MPELKQSEDLLAVAGHWIQLLQGDLSPPESALHHHSLAPSRPHLGLIRAGSAAAPVTASSRAQIRHDVVAHQHCSLGACVPDRQRLGASAWAGPNAIAGPPLGVKPPTGQSTSSTTDPARMIVDAPASVWDSFAARKNSKDALHWQDRSFPYFDALAPLYDGRCHAEGRTCHGMDHYASRAKNTPAPMLGGTNNTYSSSFWERRR